MGTTMFSQIGCSAITAGSSTEAAGNAALAVETATAMASRTGVIVLPTIRIVTRVAGESLSINNGGHSKGPTEIWLASAMQLAMVIPAIARPTFDC